MFQCRVNTKMGSMAAYQGNIRFSCEGALDQGIGSLLKKAVSGESYQMLFEGDGFVVIQPYGEIVHAPEGR